MPIMRRGPKESNDGSNRRTKTSEEKFEQLLSDFKNEMSDLRLAMGANRTTPKLNLEYGGDIIFVDIIVPQIIGGFIINIVDMYDVDDDIMVVPNINSTLFHALIQGFMTTSNFSARNDIEKMFENMIKGGDNVHFDIPNGYAASSYIRPLDMIDKPIEAILDRIYYNICDTIADDPVHDYDENGRSMATLIIPDEVCDDPVVKSIIGDISSGDRTKLHSSGGPFGATCAEFKRLSELGLGADVNRFIPNAISTWLTRNTRVALQRVIGETARSYVLTIPTGYEHQCGFVRNMYRDEIPDDSSVLDFIEANKTRLIAQNILNPLYREWLPENFKEPEYVDGTGALRPFRGRRRVFPR